MSRRRFSPAILSVVLALTLSACVGLGGEPPVVATLPIPTNTPAPTPEPSAPSGTPDLEVGAAIFAANCTRCHGINGAGDGELVLSGQVVNAGNFQDPQTASRQRPREWFHTITNGRIEQLMPPWASLSFADRWAVSYYTYTQHYTRDQVERGRAVYAAHCAECHGDSGRGDGVRAGRISDRPRSLIDQEAMSFLSDRVLYNVINEGIGTAMHGFGDVLSEEEMWAAVAYTRTLSLANFETTRASLTTVRQQEPPTPILPPTTDPAPTRWTVRGQVSNGTALATLPADLTVTLYTFDSTFNRAERTTTIDADGGFVFADILREGVVALVAVATYRDRLFTSEFLRGAALTADDEGVIALALPIYELTDDPSVITIRGMAVQVSAIGDALEIAQVVSLRNSSDRAFTSSSPLEDGRFLSAALPLPPGAIVVGFNEDGRYVTDENSAVVFDTSPVLPGVDHVMQVVYVVPYGGGAILEQPLPYDVSGSVRLLVRPLGLTVTSAGLSAQGTQTIGTTAYQVYGADQALPAGSVLRYELSGRAIDAGTVNRAGTTAPAVIDSRNLPLVLLAVVGGIFVIGIGGYLLVTRGRPTPQIDSRTLIDALARQIAELDAQQDAGTIDEAAYTTQRAALKRRLAEVIEAQTS